MIQGKRDIYPDVVKGLGILLVVLGHTCGYAWGWENLVRRVIYIFHMPLFFFVSGMFASRIRPFASEFRKIIVGLGVPFVFYLLIGLLVELLNPSTFSLPKFFFSIYNGHPCVNGPLWFLVVTACTRLVISCCPMILNLTGGGLMLLISLVLMFIPTHVLGLLPLMMGAWPLALFFMCLGSKSSNVLAFVRHLPVWLLLVIFAGTIALIILRARTFGLTAIASNLYPDKLVVAFAALGIVAMVCLSECCAQVIYMRDVLAFLGRNSLYIFALDLVASRLEWNAMIKLNLCIPLFVVLLAHLCFLVASVRPCKLVINMITPQRLLRHD